jgi:hypothetical protein
VNFDKLCEPKNFIRAGPVSFCGVLWNFEGLLLVGDGDLDRSDILESLFFSGEDGLELGGEDFLLLCVSSFSSSISGTTFFF